MFERSLCRSSGSQSHDVYLAVLTRTGALEDTMHAG